MWLTSILVLMFTYARQAGRLPGEVNPLPRSIYYRWVASELRSPPDHWTEREIYNFGVGMSGDLVEVSRICRTSTDDRVNVGLESRVKITAKTFSILHSDDWTRTEGGR